MAGTLISKSFILTSGYGQATDLEAYCQNSFLKFQRCLMEAYFFTNEQIKTAIFQVQTEAWL